jgi:hypothetical protein
MMRATEPLGKILILEFRHCTSSCSPAKCRRPATPKFQLRSWPLSWPPRLATSEGTEQLAGSDCHYPVATPTRDTHNKALGETMRKILLLALLTACQTPDRPPQSGTSAEEDQPSAAERVVQMQADAYNRHDVEAFVKLHAPDARFYRYPDSLVFEGHAALRERFEKLFAAAPQVHATTDARMVHGNFVVWKETAAGLPGDKTDTQIFIWEVHDGLITKVMGVR